MQRKAYVVEFRPLRNIQSVPEQVVEPIAELLKGGELLDGLILIEGGLRADVVVGTALRPA